jgi:hypothetical protein
VLILIKFPGALHIFRPAGMSRASFHLAVALMPPQAA